MKIPVHPIIAALVAVCLVSTASAMLVGEDQIVGYGTSEVRKGRNVITLSFAGVNGERLTAGEILSGVMEGDVLSYGDFKATAVVVDDELHWVSGGEVVDAAELPEKGRSITIDRDQDVKTQITFAGQALVPKVIQQKDAPQQRPESNTVKPVEKPEMYIADFLSYSTVRIESKTPEGTSTGTGFFYICRVKGKPNVTIPLIVTNWHVISNAVETTLVFTKKEGDRPSDKTTGYVTFYPPWERWIRHPSNDVDMAVLPLQPIVNMIKNQTKNEIFYMPYDRSMIPGEDEFRTITQLDEVAMIGYPNGRWDEINNQPIFRKGAIATRPSINYKGKREYLVDMSVFPGSSGSPILLVSEGSYYDRRQRAMALGGRIRLLGVNYATYLNRIFNKDDVQMTKAGDPEYLQPNNLGVIIHPSRLMEMEDYVQQVLLGGR